MANLRADLLSELRTQNYYTEMELVRLAQDPNMNYKIKIQRLDKILAKLSIIQQKITLADSYFQTPEQPAPQVDAAVPLVEQPEEQSEKQSEKQSEEQPVEQPVEQQEEEVQKPIIHKGQSHGE